MIFQKMKSVLLLIEEISVSVDCKFLMTSFKQSYEKMRRETQISQLIRLTSSLLPVDNDEANVSTQGQENEEYTALKIATEEDRPFPLNGISMDGIRRFIDSCGGKQKFSDLTTTQVCEKFVKPMTKVRFFFPFPVITFPIIFLYRISLIVTIFNSRSCKKSKGMIIFNNSQNYCNSNSNLWRRIAWIRRTQKGKRRPRKRFQWWD